MSDDLLSLLTDAKLACMRGNVFGTPGVIGAFVVRSNEQAAALALEVIHTNGNIVVSRSDLRLVLAAFGMYATSTTEQDARDRLRTQLKETE